MTGSEKSRIRGIIGTFVMALLASTAAQNFPGNKNLLAWVGAFVGVALALLLWPIERKPK